MAYYKKAGELFATKRPTVPAAQNHHTILVMGAPKVGKTSLLTQLLYGIESKPQPYVEETTIHQACYPEDVQLDIVETSATNACDIQKGDAFILVYSITDPASFLYVGKLQERIKDIKMQQQE